MIAALLIGTALAAGALPPDGYALDDAHNHDGTHIEGQENCGTNYMFPGDIARLGSHSFIILGADGPDHLLLDHRSGTPPHTYQFILRVHVTPEAMATYKKLLATSKKSLPAVTTIYFDKTGQQKDRSFFCLQDLPDIFGGKDPKFDKLFPIRATWQQNADFEGAFPIKETIVPQYDPLIINRGDVELLVYRYLPSYLEQTSFRKYLKDAGPKATGLLADAPIVHDETPDKARAHSSYIKWGAFDSNGETCPADYYLKSVKPPKTKHAWLILATDGYRAIATHLYDQSPQNYQTLLTFELYAKDLALIKNAPKPLLFMPQQYFCMTDVKQLAKSGALDLKGAVYVNSDLRDFKLGEKIGEIAGSKPQVPVNRTLQSLMNPEAVARDVFGLVDVQTVDPSIRVEARYNSDWDFIGRPVAGYHANRCYLTQKAAQALAQVQKDVGAQGYSLLAFDCYRPQRAVDDFYAWTQAPKDPEKMKSIFYADESRKDLFTRGYIAQKSGHTRGSTIDLTLVPLASRGPYKENVTDCRVTNSPTSQLDMGTTFDCFSEKAYTANAQGAAKANREKLKAAMEKRGFKNYDKEWWHYTLDGEPYASDGFDLEVQ